MKTHLLDSSEPIIEGRTQTAICGATVNQARFVFMWDDTEPSIKIVNYVRCCTKCRKPETFAKLEGRYIYGITDGENAKSGEREAAV